MRINNNVMALNAHRQLGMNQTAASKSMEKLSSGFRINRAGDDAAGLAISEKMRGQIRGLKQAQRNAQDGISLIQTAEGNLNETHSILQRMRELAVQASNDTNENKVDREAIQGEIAQLKAEIDRIGNDTEFNTKKLLDGSIGAKTVPGVDNAAVLSESLGSATSAQLTTAAVTTGVKDYDGDEATFVIDGANITIKHDATEYTAFDDGANVDTKGLAAKLQSDINEAIDAYNSAYGKDIQHITVEASGATDGTITFKSGSTGGASTVSIQAGATATTNFAETVLGQAPNTVASTTGTEGVFSAGGQGSINAFGGLTGDAAKMTFTVDGKDIEIDFVSVTTAAAQTAAAAADRTKTDGTELLSTVASALEKDLNQAIADYNGTVPASERVEDVTVTVKDGSFVVQSGSKDATSSVKFDNSEAAQLLGVAGQSSATQGGGIRFQIGANQKQEMQITIGDMRADALGINGIDLSTREGASEAISTIESAITQVSTQRSELGAFQNRLEHTISNLGTSAENLQAAESRIRDLDMAEEIMAFTKNNILQQAATAMLAQANMAPQSVLQLLG